MNRVIKYFGLIKNDLRTMHWASGKELKKSFSIVLLISALIGFYVFVLDTTLTSLYKLIIF